MRALSCSRRGATMVETAVASVGAVMLVGLVATTMHRSNRVFEQTATVSEVDSVAQRAVERVAREFMDADRSTLNMTPTTGPNAASFCRATGYAAGALRIGARRRIRFEYAPGETNDGRDQNGNGLVDEGRIVLNDDVQTGAGREMVLVENVAERLAGELENGADDNGNGMVDENGLTLTYDATTFTLTLRLTLVRLQSDGSVLDRSAETTVRLRND